MKLKVSIVMFLFVLLVGCERTSYVSDVRPRETSKFCRETTGDGSKGSCFSGLQVISGNYVLLKGNVYWRTVKTYSESACAASSGDATAAIPNLLSPKCWIGGHERYYVSEYHLYFVVKHSPDFRVLGGEGGSVKVDWQQLQLQDYATDLKSVYFQGRVIREADPKRFSVIFPFGDNEDWDAFYVSQSGAMLFLSGVPQGDIDISGFHYFETTKCPGHGLPCTSEKDLADFIRSGQSIVGWSGSDIILLRGERAYKFNGMMSKDAYVFSSIKRTYFYSNGKFYEFKFEDERGLERGVKLFDMDVEYYRANNY
ncbi:hypothetical protein KW851_24635 [Pseudomonas sp. PDM33]|uniref:hypothetical protein n=1 Tax=unclassified Pseudomonas TaxID=196821 RepID=UPI0012E02775|nr:MULTISPECIES: hypothetical protein [unclassified Pseudomonas]MBV7586039.1 hypothetical protein [Pseudomonas sp. PDM33]